MALENVLEKTLELLSDAFSRIKELEDTLTELQIFLNAEGVLPGVHYLGEHKDEEKTSGDNK